MAVRLHTSYLRRSYQLLATLASTSLSPEEAFERAANIIYMWARGKYRWVFPELPTLKTTLDEKRNGNELGVLYTPETYSFILRCVHPDSSVAGRHWMTDVALKKEGEVVRLAVCLSVSSLHSCDQPVPFSTPKFVYNIMQSIGLCDGMTLSDKPRVLDSETAVDEFCALLQDRCRQMPVVLLTPCYDESEALCKGYMMNAHALAKDLLGVAHVFCLSSGTNEYLTEKIGKSWSAFDGAVRTYYPSLSFEDSNCYQHPLMTRLKIRLINIENDFNIAAAADRVKTRVQEFSVARRIPWDNCGITFYLTAHQAVLRQERASGEQSAERMRQSYETQLLQLQQQYEEAMALADSYAKDVEVHEASLEQERQLTHNLKSQIEALRVALSFKETSSPEKPETDYSKMAEWIESRYSDRLVILPRAKRSLKEAVYEDAGLVCRCLQLLANTYYSHRTGEIDRVAYLEACRAVDAGLSEEIAITDTAAGMEGDEYFVYYDGKRHKLERHLVKGNSKDRRRCLRIYYFWDDERQLTVVGDLPHHLDTSAT